MAIFLQRHPEGKIVDRYLLKLLVNTKLPFAIVGICGTAIFANGLGAGPYGILIGAFVGFLASIIASEEMRACP